MTKEELKSMTREELEAEVWQMRLDLLEIHGVLKTAQEHLLHYDQKAADEKPSVLQRALGTAKPGINPIEVGLRSIFLENAIATTTSYLDEVGKDPEATDGIAPLSPPAVAPTKEIAPAPAGVAPGE